MAVSKKVVWQIALVVLLLAAGAAALAAFALSKKPPARKVAQVVTPMVRIVEVGNEPVKVSINGEGTVIPVAQPVLAAEVAGRVVYVSPHLVAGGSFKKGELLMKIEQKDYRLALTLAEASVKAAETSLRTTKEEAASAREEWQLLDKDSGQKFGEPPALLVKEPQIAQYQASLEGAQAQVEQARLNLMRTEVRAPFDGRVVSENVDLGQYLTKGGTIATVFSTEAAEINVHIEDHDLAWLDVPGLTTQGKKGSPAVVTAEFAGRKLSWQGRIVRALGQVNQSTRLVGVVVRVDDPLRHPSPPGHGRLRQGGDDRPHLGPGQPDTTGRPTSGQRGVAGGDGRQAALHQGPGGPSGGQPGPVEPRPARGLQGGHHQPARSKRRHEGAHHRAGGLSNETNHRLVRAKPCGSEPADDLFPPGRGDHRPDHEAGGVSGNQPGHHHHQRGVQRSQPL